MEQAIALCLEWTRLGGADEHLQVLLGACYGRVGDYRAAAGHLEKALAINPGNIHALNNLGLAYKHLGDAPRALAAWSRAIDIAPSFIEALQHRGELYLEAGDAAAARDDFEKIIRFRPYQPGALSALGSICEAEGDYSSARACFEKALHASPGHCAAHLGLAGLDLTAGDTAPVITRLTGLLQTEELTPVNKSIALTRLGFAFEKRKAYERAFRCFQEANSILRAHHATRWPGAGTVFSPTALRRIAADLETADTAFPPAVDYGPAPVFLVGFPRSGTTLLEQILAAHPAIVTVEENDNLSELYPLLGGGAEPLRTLAGLSQADLAAYRAAYRQSLQAAAGSHPGRLVIDKQPLYTALLPVIGMLFPGARIIFAVRDPRDVVISCYQQNFGMNEAMYQFLDLETAVEYYDLVMAIGEKSLAGFPLRCHHIFYESLIDDLRGTVSALLTFLDLQWDDKVLEFATRSRGRHIDTPSGSQVRKPVGGEAIGKYRRYCKWLPPAFGKLEVWARKYGYR